METTKYALKMLVNLPCGLLPTALGRIKLERQANSSFWGNRGGPNICDCRPRHRIAICLKAAHPSFSDPSCLSWIWRS
jgi:hypothetical protein